MDIRTQQKPVFDSLSGNSSVWLDMSRLKDLWNIGSGNRASTVVGVE